MLQVFVDGQYDGYFAGNNDYLPDSDHGHSL